MAIQGPSNTPFQPGDYNSYEPKQNNLGSSPADQLNQLIDTLKAGPPKGYVYTGFAKTYVSNLIIILQNNSSFLETMPNLGSLLTTLYPYSTGGGPGQPIYYPLPPHGSGKVPNMSSPVPFDEGTIECFTKYADSSPLGNAVISNGTVTTSDITSNFSRVDWGMEIVLQSMIQGQAFHEANPSFNPPSITLQTFPAAVEFQNFFSAQTEILNELNQNHITSINFDDPGSASGVAAKLEDYYTQYMGYDQNPFSSAPVGGTNTLLGFLASKGLYQPSGSAIEYIQQAAQTADTMLREGKPITSTEWNNFKTLFSELSNSTNPTYKAVSGFMINMIDNISSVPTSLQAWLMLALDQGLQSTTQPPRPSDFYDWASNDLPGVTGQEFFSSDTSTGIQPPISDFSMLLYNVMLGFNDPGVPTGADLIKTLVSGLSQGIAKIPMPGAGGPYPDISNLFTQDNPFYNLIMTIAGDVN